MKNFFKLIAAVSLFFLTAIICVAQDVTGSWSGKLNAAQGVSLELIFNVSANPDGSLSATLDSPQEGVRGLAMDSATYENGTLTIESKRLSMTYKGIYLMGVLNGTFSQRGIDIPLALSKVKVTKPRRPQTPAGPFPYSEEEVSFDNERENVNLVGTLTMPKNSKDLHAVVLVSGSGAQNRDEELYDHKPFAVIADYLTREGLAVLRVDDRGVGASEGDRTHATSINFMYDTEAAINYLFSRPEIKEVSVLGHSEGGLITYMIAEHRKDIKSIVSLAGPAVSGHDVLIEQTKAALRAQNVPESVIEQSSAMNTQLYDFVVETKDLTAEEFSEKLNVKLHQILGPAAGEDQIAQIASQLDNEWMRFFINYDPSDAIRNVDCPLLFINGTKDCQVISSQNVPAMKELTKGKKNVRIEEMVGLNHILQEANTGSVQEYYEIEQTISPAALAVIAEFLKK